MAGNCPHNTLLESSLKHSHKEHSNTHETYRKIIDDLKNDLEQISCEVIMVQKEYTDQEQCNDISDIDLEVSLKELETQNDKLQQALELQTQTKEATFTELQTNNKYLESQIDHLRHKVFNREQRIMQLTNILQSFSQMKSPEPQRAALENVASHNNYTVQLEKKIEKLTQKLDKSMEQERFLHKETRKLNEELNESKRKNGDLISQAKRLSSHLKSQENNHMELMTKYEALESNYEDQAIKLRTANKQLCMLNERFQVMEKRQYEHNFENNLLREEVLSLKEKHACAIGSQKSAQEQLLKIEKELYTAHDVINEQRNIMQRNESNHKEMMHRLNETNADIKRKLANLVEDYKKLQQEYDKQKEINIEQNKLTENYHKWKEQQLRAENNVRENFKQLEDCIRDLLEEKQTYLANYLDLQKDYILLQNELDRFKMCSFSHSNYNVLQNGSEKSIAEHLEIVRRTTRRVLEQNSTLKDKEREGDLRCDSSVAGIPSKEPF